MTQQIQNPAQASSNTMMKGQTQYRYDIRMTTKQYVVKVSTSKQRGCYEHHEWGEARGGGLLFDGVKLNGYEGTSVLPAEVTEVLASCGFIVPDVFRV